MSKLKQKAKEVRVMTIKKSTLELKLFNLFFHSNQVIQAESDELRRQDANKTALAAIGPRKKRKIDESSTNNIGPTRTVTISFLYFVSKPNRLLIIFLPKQYRYSDLK